MKARPVVSRVSHATRLAGSSVRQASRMASEIWSAILSGWPSVTDSEVNKYRFFDAKLCVSFVHVFRSVVRMLLLLRRSENLRTQSRAGYALKIHAAATEQTVYRSPAKRLPDPSMARNGFDPKCLWMNSIAEMWRWMEGKVRRVEASRRFESTCAVLTNGSARRVELR